MDKDRDKFLLERLELWNFRGFRNFEIDFHHRLTVLVAQNGCGKTAVLDALAVALGPFVGAFDGTTGSHFSSSDARLARSRRALSEMEAQFPVRLEASGFLDGHSTTWSRELTGARGRTTYKEARELIAYGHHLQKQVREAADLKRKEIPLLPLVAYYGTGRLWGEMRLSGAKKDATSRTAAYVDCLTPSSRYKLFADWFERLNRAEYDERHNASRLRAIRALTGSIRRAVDTVLQPSGWHGINFRSSEAGIVVEHKTAGSLPVSWLSDGVRNVIGLAADIAHRAARLNAHLGKDAVARTPGIVLIDEVDMHLHPAWQQMIIDSLLNAFPAIQFVVTTHSPQVVTTVHQENVRVLRHNKAHMMTISTYGAESQRVMSDAFDVSSRPPDNENALAIKSIFSEIHAGKLDEAELACQHLMETMGTDEPALVEAQTIIENRRWEKELGL